MKTSLLIKLIMVSGLLSATLAAHADAAKPTILLENGGFETASLAPWVDFSTGAVVVSDTPAEGKYCVKLKPGSGVKYIVNGLKPNTTYVFGGTIKVESGTQGRITIQLDDSARGAVSQMMDKTEWAPGSVTITTGANDTSIQCIFWNDSASGNTFGDGFTLVAQ